MAPKFRCMECRRFIGSNQGNDLPAYAARFEWMEQMPLSQRPRRAHYLRLILLACHIDVFYDTSRCMKTTVEIPNSLLKQVKDLASKEHTTVRAVVEEGLRHIIDDRKRAKPFRLRKASFRGKGLQPQMAGAPWAQIRETIYEGRGA